MTSLRAENERLRLRLAEAEQTLEAIHQGQVDSLVVQTAEGPRVYALEGNSNAHRILLESMSEGAATLSPSGVVTYCNRRLASLVGLPLQEVMGASVHDLLAEDHRGDLDALLQTDDEAHVETLLRCIRGQDVPVYVSARAVDVDSDKLICLVIVDLRSKKHTETLQIEAQAQLHAAEERFHQLIDAISDYAIFMLDSTGHVMTWSPGAEKIQGYGYEEIIGKHFSIFYTPEDRTAGKPERIMEIVRREGRFEDEGWRLRKDGSRFCANVVTSALRDEAGEVTGFAKVARDLTSRRAAEDNERRLAEEQLALSASEAARREMERVNRAKDEFLATMSHELRTPLNAIQAWASILRKKPRDEEKLDRGLEVIERNANAQTRLVSDLMDVSRIISGKLQLTVRKSEVLPVIFAAADVVRPAAEGKGVRLVVDVDPDIGATMADADRLQQVVWNLLTNAVRYTPRGGRVTVSGDRSASGIVIRVHDTGAGIAPEHLPHVFERFMQADASTTREHGGLGLGLSIVRHLVEAHGGTVEAHSDGLGRGASFTVKLPIRAVSTIRPEAEGGMVEEAGTEATETPEPDASLQGVRVLVVDDDRDALEVVREVLERAAAQVTGATSAREAFDAIEQGASFELIISDIGMPGVDGYTFIRRIRARDRGGDIPAIALTAYVRATDAERARDAGFQEHLAKPIDERQLLRVVRTWSKIRNAVIH